MPRFDVTTVGEASLRLSVPAGDRLALANQLDLHVAGTEANVTAALAQLEHRCGWISALPKSPLGERAKNAYGFTGLDMTAVKWVENGRMATFFVEFAALPRPTQVYYDRKNSAFSQMTHRDIDWDYLLDSKLIHLTGITAALSENCCALVFEIIKRAKEANVAVGFDVNYRSKLWTPDKARSTLGKMLPDVDLLFCSKRDANQVFDIDGEPEKIVTQFAERFGVNCMAMSDGENGVYGWENGRVLHTPAVNVDIIDRIGAGDALAAGIIHGWLSNDFAKGLEFGTIAAASAMSHNGDLLVISRDELNDLYNNRDITLFR